MLQYLANQTTIMHSEQNEKCVFKDFSPAWHIHNMQILVLKGIQHQSHSLDVADEKVCTSNLQYLPRDLKRHSHPAFLCLAQ